MALAILLLALGLGGASEARAQGRFNERPGGHFGLNTVDPIRQINEHRGHLGWGIVWVGMTHKQVSKAVGKRLPIPDEVDNGFGCKRSIVETRFQHQDLIFEFSDLGEVAPLRAIWVVIPQARRRPLDPTSVAKALKKRLPKLRYVSSAGGRRVAEGIPRMPLYAASNGERLVIDPDRGVYLGDLCLRMDGVREPRERGRSTRSDAAPP